MFKLDFTEIVPERLWIGADPSKNDLVELKRKFGSELVIMDLTGSSEEKAWCRELGINYDERTPLVPESGQPIPISRLKISAAVIGDNVDSGKKVILHCLKGRGRSPTLPAAYLMQSGMSVTDSKNTITTKRQVWERHDEHYAGPLQHFRDSM